MFDEPSSYLDVKQRLSAARTIRELLRPDDYVIVVEHDLSVLDYLSDFICVLYGRPAVYGVVTLPASVREGINIFLDGNIPTENLRFREESLTFRIAEAGEEFMVDRARGFSYPKMVRFSRPALRLHKRSIFPILQQSANLPGRKKHWGIST